MTYTIIIPVFNEERILPKLLKSLQKIKNSNIEIIIIDDGSNDKTKDILSDKDFILTLKNKINRGKGAAIKKALKSANNQNIILIDGDLEIDIEVIPVLIEMFENNDEDVITGVRWMKNSYPNFEINSIGNFLVNFLFNILYKTKLSDVLCCLKIINTNLFKSLNIKSNGFEIEIETMSKIILSRIPVKEVNINYNRRSKEEGKKLKTSDGWKIIWTMIRMRFEKNLF